MSQLKNGSSQCLWMTSICIVLLLMSMARGAVSTHYKEALTKSLLYFEAQRSGKLPSHQRVTWRGDSALRDGSDAHVDLTGGYYDAGDNMKFGFPLAFTTTMLAWSSIEMASQLKAHKEYKNALVALKWATDYLIKAHPEPNVLYGQVGEGNSDHGCWMRPEDMTTPRPSYRIDAQHPGADLAGETAAAMAAASMAFAPSNKAYAKILIGHAKDLFEFAKAYPGFYQNSITNAGGFYASSGYEDELLWAAAWLHRATNDQTYLDYLIHASGSGGPRTVFAWDDKYLGAQVLVAKLALERKVECNGKIAEYKSMAEQFICNCAQKGSNNVRKTPGGLLWFLPWNNLQYTTAASFVLSAYSKYLEEAKASIQCPQGALQASDLLDLARSQLVLEGKVKNEGKMKEYKSRAEQFICNCAQKGFNNVKKTPGGLLWFLPWNNLQYTATASFVLATYAKYLEDAQTLVQCPNGGFLQASDLLNLARAQVDYILGSNPKNMSYMVGYGTNYPKRPHHRGASIVSIKSDPKPVTCNEGFGAWYSNPKPNPNVLVGAVVGGPNENDAYEDERSDYQHDEPDTVTVAPLVSVLAAIA